MSSKLRVYEVARELGMDNKEIVALLQSMGFGEVRNHMSVVSSDAVDRIRRHQERKAEPKVVEERIRPTVVKRRSLAKPADQTANLAPEPAIESTSRSARTTVVLPLKSSPVAAPPPARLEPRPSSDVHAVTVTSHFDVGLAEASSASSPEARASGEPALASSALYSYRSSPQSMLSRVNHACSH